MSEETLGNTIYCKKPKMDERILENLRKRTIKFSPVVEETIILV